MLVSQVWALCGHNLGSLFWMAGCKIMRGQPFAVAFAFSLSHAQNNDEWIGLDCCLRCVLGTICGLVDLSIPYHAQLESNKNLTPCGGTIAE
jgi:hypothetical protein